MGRAPVIYLVLAAVIRFGVLTYALVADPDPVWSWDSVAELKAATQIVGGAGTVLPYSDDYGLRYVHVALSAFGPPSFVKLQLLQVSIDSLLVLAAWRVGKRLGGEKTAHAAAFLFAVFMPEVVLAAIPDYDIWATWGMLISVWLMVESLNSPKRMATLGILAGAIPALFAVIRSTIMLFAPLTALALFCVASRRLSYFVLTGWLLIAAPLAVKNYGAYGEARLLRGSIGHGFWCGVGQFPNNYGVEPTDASVFALYTRLSGQLTTNSQDSETVLTEAAVNYVKEHPIEYGWNLIRRSLLIVFPRNYWGPWADQWHPRFTQTLEVLARSPLEFALNYPIAAILGGIGLIGDRLILPLCMIVAVAGLKQQAIIPLLPLLYTTATLGPLYSTPRNTANAYAAILPLCAFGLIRLGEYVLRTRSKRLPPASIKERSGVPGLSS